MPPPNVDPPSALALDPLPYALVEATDRRGGVWFVYTPADPTVVVIGVFVYSAAALYLDVYSPDGVTAYPPDDPVSGLHNLACQLPVVQGVPVYLNVRASPFGPEVTGEFTISVLAGPNLPAPAGSLLVNDDLPGWPVALLSATDGSVLQFRAPFPSGENGDALASGVILVHDRSNDHLKLYSAALTLLVDLAYGAATGNRYPIRRAATRFYVGQPQDPAHANKATVTTVSAAGAFGPTTWVLPLGGLSGIAPNSAETILYHAGQSSVTNSPVGRWDLVNDLALTDLAAGQADYNTQDDILVLADDSIVVGYESNISGATAPKVLRYNGAGATLNTYTLTGSLSNDLRLAYALDDPVSFWVWSKLASNQSRFTNLRASDGAVLATFDAMEFEDGRYAGSETATPVARFGHSESCPFFLLRADLAAVPGGGNGGGGNGGGGNGGGVLGCVLSLDPAPAGGGSGCIISP